jgi:type VI secretion system protein ImpK
MQAPVPGAEPAAPRSVLPVVPTPATLANTANPFVLASTDVLTLLGRLRVGMTDTPTPALYEHILQAIGAFDAAMQSLPVDQHDALVAKYALCGTVDDIVQNLPDIDQGFWRNQPLVARFFAKRDSNVGFFQEAQKAIQSPATRYNLLEFMLTCLNLGFQGQYRNTPGGTADLASIRNAILQTLRRTRSQEGRRLSVMWEPVRLRDRSRARVLPIWAVTAMATLAVVAFFATLSSVLNRDGATLAESLYALHPVQSPIALERAPGPVFEAPASQFERLGEGLGDDLAGGRIELSQLGNFIIIRLGNANMFASGSAEVNPAFRPLGARIAAGLDAEPGPITVLGYTDSRGAFNTNMTLSVARAEAVADILKEGLSDPLRVRVEGRGPTDPIADNSTEEGRAKNRRVEIKLAREGTF